MLLRTGVIDVQMFPHLFYYLNIPCECRGIPGTLFGGFVQPFEKLTARFAEQWSTRHLIDSAYARQLLVRSREKPALPALPI